MRLRAMWHVLRGLPTMYNVNSIELYFSDAAAVENNGMLMEDCSHCNLYLPPSWPIHLGGAQNEATFIDHRPPWHPQYTDGDD